MSDARSQDTEIIKRFIEIHPGWNIDIQPPPKGASSGSIRQPGGSGLIRYVFGDNERGRFLEYYSFHRIWGDSHARIYAAGEVESLDTLETTLMVTDDPTEDRRQRDLLHRRNQRLMADLEQAGLLSGGPVPGSFQINAAILTGAVDPDEDSPPLKEAP
jgi:hypothetical protein